MSDAAGSVDKQAYLPVEFIRQFREISGEFGAHDFARDLSSVNSLEGMNVAGFKPRQIAVQCWYVYTSDLLYVIFYHRKGMDGIPQYCGCDS